MRGSELPRSMLACQIIQVGIVLQNLNTKAGGHFHGYMMANILSYLVSQTVCDSSGPRAQ
jgi:hypothetical protein